LHLIPDIHYLEIVDDEGREVKAGKSGNIIITLLTNYTMPLIRCITFKWCLHFLPFPIENNTIYKGSGKAYFRLESKNF